MKNLCNIILVVGMLCLQMTSWAQTTGETELTQQEQLKRFLYQNTLMPQERVHIMTDRNHYLTGDTIWMRAFVVDGLYKKPVHYSRFLYVELRDEQDQLITRVKLHEQPERGDSIMRGYLPTQNELPTGVYTIAAYTQWMLNGDESLFFKRNVQLVNVADMERNILTEPLLGTTGCDAYHRVDSTALSKADMAVKVVRPVLQTDQVVYGSRERVTVRMQVPPNSSLAVSVTDNAATIVDIRSAIHYDLLGQPYWHNLDSIYAGRYRRPTYLNEISQEVSGHLRGKLRHQPLAHTLVLLSSPSVHLFRSTRTDSLGNFLFEDFDLPDTVSCMISASNGRRTKGEVQLTPSPLPEVVHHLEAPVKPVSRVAQDSNDSLTVSKMKQRARFSNGQWEITLGEVGVATRKRLKGEDQISHFSERKFGRKEIQEMNAATLEGVLLSIPGIIIDYDSAGSRVAKYRGKVLNFMLNDWEVAPYLKEGESEFDYVDNFCPIDCIEYLDVVSAIYASSSGSVDHNAYAVRIKYDPTLVKKNDRGILTFKPLGHQLPRDFLQTDYSTEQARSANPPGTDMRSTLYWNPTLQVDSTGVASFSFWTNDNYNTVYSIRVEGVSEEGHLINALKRIKMK
ncbi:MAG: hypothetical protein K6E86_02915 [Bacteroidales bacterium]|nr:hypothetical protein [Bacteroidales bacterium]